MLSRASSFCGTHRHTLRRRSNARGPVPPRRLRRPKGALHPRIEVLLDHGPAIWLAGRRRSLRRKLCAAVGDLGRREYCRAFTARLRPSYPSCRAEQLQTQGTREGVKGAIGTESSAGGRALQRAQLATAA